MKGIPLTLKSAAMCHILEHVRDDQCLYVELNGPVRTELIVPMLYSAKVTNPREGRSMLSKLMVILTLCCAGELAEVGENSTITEMDRNLQ